MMDLLTSRLWWGAVIFTYAFVRFAWWWARRKS